MEMEDSQASGHQGANIELKNAGSPSNVSLYVVCREGIVPRLVS